MISKYYRTCTAVFGLAALLAAPGGALAGPSPSGPRTGGVPACEQRERTALDALAQEQARRESWLADEAFAVLAGLDTACASDAAARFLAHVQLAQDDGLLLSPAVEAVVAEATAIAEGQILAGLPGAVDVEALPEGSAVFFVPLSRSSAAARYTFDTSIFATYAGGLLDGATPGTAEIDFYFFDETTGLPVASATGQDVCNPCNFPLGATRQPTTVWTLRATQTSRPGTAATCSLALLVVKGDQDNVNGAWAVTAMAGPVDLPVYRLPID